jgi:hypothetical protein
MDDSDFDRLARALSGIRSRRGFLVIAGGFAALLAPRLAGAVQLGPSSCGSAGDVCTMMMGCCDGLTCATSAINTNYGVCVTGEGERTVVGTSLISPFADGVEEQVTVLANQVATAASNTTATDREAELEARKDEKQARRETRQDEIRARRDTQKSNRELRRDDRQEEQELQRGPQLKLELFHPGGVDGTESVQVTNLDDETVMIMGIASLKDPKLSTVFTESRPEFLDAGHSFLFLSEPEADGNLVNDVLAWTPDPVCKAEIDGDGFIVSAAFDTNSEIHRYIILCDMPVVSFTPPPEPRKRHKRKSKGGKDGGNGNGGAKSRSKPKSRAKGRKR